jgi:hypothetical protein
MLRSAFCEVETWFYLGVVGILLLFCALATVILWPFAPRIRIDPHAEPFGDLPRVPSERPRS